MGSKISIMGILLLVLALMLASGAVAVENMVKNPDFDKDMEGWTLGCLTDGAAGELLLEAGLMGNCMHAKIDALGNDGWEPEIHSPDFAVDNGKTYTIAFLAKTEAGKTRDLGVKFEQLDIWGGPSGPVTVTDQWKDLHFTGVMDFQSPPNSVIHIQFEGSTADVWLDHFRVYPGDYVEEKLAPVTPTGRLTTVWGQIKSR